MLQTDFPTEAHTRRKAPTMGAASSQQVTEVWPPDWENMSESSRKIARSAILSLSALPPDEFLAISEAEHAIAKANWKFEEYHAAAAAAVQEDIKLNKIIYRLVPRKCEESEFWRLYFSQARDTASCAAAL